MIISLRKEDFRPRAKNWNLKVAKLKYRVNVLNVSIAALENSLEPSNVWYSPRHRTSPGKSSGFE
jgi:hypothetical protein